MATLEATTELDAVNSMLLSIGQAPVSTLTVTGIRDVNLARAELIKMARRVQTIGWSWNTDTNYHLPVNSDGLILIPAGALSVDPEDKTQELTVRKHPTAGMALYDNANHTFVVTEAVPCKIVWAFDFESLPEAARSYIALSAGRRFQSKVVGSPILDRFEEEDVTAAWLVLMRDERRTADANLFRRNPRLRQFYNRRSGSSSRAAVFGY